VIAAFVTTFLAVSLNVPASRRSQQAAVLAGAAALYLGSSSLLVAASFLATFLVVMPNTLYSAYSKELNQFNAALALVLGLGLLAAAWPFGWWGLGPAVPILLALMLAPAQLKGRTQAIAALRTAKVRVGEPLPDISLPKRVGDERFELAAHRGKFVLLCFVRGDWCPMCHVMMRVIAKQVPTLEKHNVKMVMITPSRGEIDPEFGAEIGVGKELYLDEGSAVARSLGLLQGNKHDGEDVPLPVAVLVDPQGVVRHVSRPDEVTAFANEDRLVAALESGLPQAA
jgi:peroxiredoxin